MILAGCATEGIRDYAREQDMVVPCHASLLRLGTFVSHGWGEPDVSISVFFVVEHVHRNHFRLGFNKLPENHNPSVGGYRVYLTYFI